MRRLTFLLLCLFIGIGVATAQTMKITGNVISSEDQQPVIGAAVVVKGTTIGTVTDFEGNFSLDVPRDAKMIFISYVGLKTKEVPVASVINVVLDSDSKALDEVVVTAMGLTREKKALGYALQEVKSDELTKAGQQSLATSLSGKIAGVQITSQGGQVGASQNIVVRGNSSFGNNQPLIVVDGVPIANDNAKGATVNLGSGLNDINPEDIESISVLKGGSAALYGMRAGNGVILVTTKSGKKDKGVSISYEGDITIDRVYNLPRLQNKYGQGYYASEYDWKEAQAGGYSGDYQAFALENGYNYVDGMGSGINDNADESWGPRLDIGLNLPQYNSPVIDGVRQATPWVSSPDNIKNFFQTGYSMNHTVALSASTDKTSTRASLSFRDQGGTTPNTDQKRYAMAVNTKMTFNKYIDFDLSANYIRTKSANLPGTGYNSTNALQSIMQWFGRAIKDYKGITENVELSINIDGYPFICDLKNWEVFNIEDSYEFYKKMKFHPIRSLKDKYGQRIPGCYRATFQVKKPGDTFLNFETWGKGLVYVNGYALGRIWEIGPQQTLYVPGCWTLLSILY